MPLWLTDILALCGFGLLIGLGVLVLYGLWNLAVKPERYVGSKLLRWFEVPWLVLIILAVIGSMVAVMLNSPLIGIMGMTSISDWTEVRAKFMMELCASGLPFLAALMAIRWIPSTRWSIPAASLLLFGGIAFIYQLYVAKFRGDLQLDKDPLAGILTLSRQIPIRAAAAVRLAIPLMAIVGGLACYLARPRWYSFVGGGILIGMLMFHLSQPIPAEGVKGLTMKDMAQTYASGLTMLGLLVGTLWVFPGLRAALLRAAGASEDSDHSGLTQIFRHVFVSLSVILAILCFANGQLEARMVRLIMNGPPPLTYAPNLVNAWDSLGDKFDRRKKLDEKLIPMMAYEPTGNRQDFFHDETDLGKIRAAITDKIRAGIAADDQRAADFIKAFEEAGRADYFSSYDGDQYVAPSFLAQRQISRHLGVRVRMNSADGDWQKALADIDTLLGYTALEMDGTLVCHMIHCAIQGIGCAATTVYWQAFRDNREAMDGLARVLESHAKGNRRSFPTEQLRRSEPGFQGIVPFADVAVPSFLRAHTIFLRNVGRYDIMRIAAALELYRLDHGAYPDTLEALAPEYLPRIPLSPMDGKPLVYRVEPGQLVLATQTWEDKKKSSAVKEFHQPMQLPLPTETSNP